MFLKSYSFIKRQKSFTNLITYGIGQAFNLVTPILVIPYIIHVCGILNYGKAAFGMALTFFLIVFIDYGSDINGVKAIATNRDDPKALQKIFSETYAGKLAILLLVVLAMAALFLFVPYFKQDDLLYLLGLPILIGQFLNPTWFLQGTENFLQITILNIVSKGIYLAGIFLFITQPSDYVLINLWWGIGMIVANGISFLYIVNRYKFSFSQISVGAVAKNLHDGFPIFYSQIFVSVQLYAPLILIGFFGSDLMAGMYRVVEQVVVIFKTYILLFFNFMYPKVCYLIDHNAGEARRFWLVYNAGNFVFVLLSMILIYFFSEAVVAYFNPKDTEYLSGLLEVAVWIPALMALSIPMKQMLLAYNFNQFYVRATIALVIANMVLIVLLLPRFQLYGVLFSLIVVEIVTACIFFLKIKNRLFLR